MSVWDRIKDETVTVAPQSSENAYGDSYYGNQEEIDCKINRRDRVSSITGPTENEKAEIMVEKVITDEREFKESDIIWLPGADTSKVGEGQNPRNTYRESVAGYTLYVAEL